MKSFIFCVFLLFLSACQPEEKVPDGRIKIKNDFLDKTYNILEVSGGGSSFSLKPGQYALLPAGTRTFSFKREYENYRREYSVSCPEFKSTSTGIVVKMIDVHSNRIAGGCKTVRAEKIN